MHETTADEAPKDDTTTDETARPGRAAGTRRLLEDRLSATSTRLHRAVFDASRGRVFGKAFGMPVVKLVTVGRKTGAERSTMLAAPIADRDRVVLVASNRGDDRQPAWYRNLQANPQVEVTLRGSTRTLTARTATEAERSTLWPQVTSVFDGYARYQARTTRTIPVVILEHPPTAPTP